MRTLDAELRGQGFQGRIRAAEPLAAFTTWRIGGPAELLAEPENEDDLRRAVAWAESAGLGWRVLGNGSNLLVADAGVSGLVLRLRRVLDSVDRDGTRLRAGAGASFPAVARQAAACGLAGIEFGAGIPGTIGGAIVMNAGWHEFEIGNAVEAVRLLHPDGSVETLDAPRCGFAYRTSRFRGARGVVLGATLRLEEGDAAAIEARLEGFAASRKANQPTERPSCGSVFEKPPGDFAGRLIDAAGLKGLRAGAIEISPKHANFFVNLGGGTAAQVLELVARVEHEVLARFGIELVREFEYWD